jgi:DNA-binding LytR/AlgR family response regulator
VKVLVVDDEPLARSRLIRMLQKVSLVGSIAEAENGRRALEQTRLLHPDVVLLDIRMPGISGIEVAQAAPPEIAIIFTTAHDEHAVEAFEVAAIDYLLKPIAQERLERALERVQRGALASVEHDLVALYDRLQASRIEGADLRITVRKGDSLRIFDPSEIDRLSSAGAYTSFHQGDEEFLINESLSTLEARLEPLGFQRVHRSELIRIGAVRAIHIDEGGTTVELSSGERAPVSRRLLTALKNVLGNKL